MKSLTFVCLLGSLVGCLAQGPYNPGADDPTLNLALGRATFQSSTYPGGDSSLAVNGNYDSAYDDGSCTHTDTQEGNPWWAVDLGASYEVTTIFIYNREDCCSDRIAGVTMVVSDQALAPGDDISTLTSNLCAADDGAMGTSAWIDFECAAGATGRYVYLYLPTDEFLTICEVSVYSSGAVCQDSMVVQENMHAEGGLGQPDIPDVDACFALCLSQPDCIGFDWNFLDNPWMGMRCWLHTEAAMGVVHADAGANHYDVVRCPSRYSIV